jgi:hypothetical protein
MSVTNDDGRLRNIIADHCLLLDQKRFRDYADLFSDDAQLYLHGELQAQGREAIFAWVQAHAMPPGRHLTSNIRIEIDGEQAHGLSSLAFVAADNVIGFVGDYEARFLKVDGDWKISEWRAGFSLAAERERV